MFSFLICSCWGGSDNSEVEIKARVLEIVRYNQIEKLFQSGEYIMCINEAKKFTNEFPNNDQGWNLLGGAYMALGDIANDSLSNVYVDKAISLNQYNYSALLNKGVLLDRFGDYPTARKYYLRALEINPEYPMIYSNFVGNRLKVQDYSNAVKYGEIAIKMADRLSDKAILCYSYHLNRQYSKRDSLLTYLKVSNYPYIEGLILKLK